MTSKKRNLFTKTAVSDDHFNISSTNKENLEGSLRVGVVFTGNHANLNVSSSVEL